MITEILWKSLKEAFNPKRFSYFFLLYLIFSACALIFSRPVLAALPALLSLQFTDSQIAVVMLNMVAMFIVFVLVVVLNVWFTGALVYGFTKKVGFDQALRYSQSLYWRMSILGFILVLIYAVSSIFKSFAFWVRLLANWIFMFSLPALIIKKDSFEQALARSFEMVKKKPIQTGVLWILLNLIRFSILFICLILVAVASFPLLSDLSDLMAMRVQTSTLENQQLAQVVNTLLNSYPLLFLIAVIISFFFSVSYVFDYACQTFYFLKMKR